MAQCVHPLTGHPGQPSRETRMETQAAGRPPGTSAVVAFKFTMMTKPLSSPRRAPEPRSAKSERRANGSQTSFSMILQSAGFNRDRPIGPFEQYNHRAVRGQCNVHRGGNHGCEKSAQACFRSVPQQTRSRWCGAEASALSRCGTFLGARILRRPRMEIRHHPAPARLLPWT